MITLVVEAYGESNSYFPGETSKKQIKIVTFEGQAFAVLSLSLFPANTGCLFSPLADSNDSHAYVI